MGPMGRRMVPVEEIQRIEGVGWVLGKEFFGMGADEFPGYFVVKGLKNFAGHEAGPVFTLGRPVMSQRGVCIGWAYLDFNHNEIRVIDRALWRPGEVMR